MTDLQSLTVDDIESAYIGTASKCACGCSGTYYGPDYGDSSKVAAILQRVQSRGRRADAGVVEPLWTHTYTGGGEMFAYQTQSQLIRIETKGLNEEGAN